MKKPEDIIIYTIGDNVNIIQLLCITLFHVCAEIMLIGKQNCFSGLWRSLGGYDLEWGTVVEDEGKEMFLEM